MTPQERQLVAELFERLAALEGAPRDADAERAVAEGLQRAPNALYPLVQTVLVQDEALKNADVYIKDLEQQLGIRSEPQPQGGFLDSMRDALFGRREAGRGSVPSVRGEGAMGVPPGFRGGAPAAPGYAGMPQPAGQGGSFLGTAAAAAAGVIGGSLLLDSFRSMAGQRQGGHGAFDPGAAGGERSPWSGDAANSELARDAGLGEIGRGGRGESGSERHASLFGDDTSGTDAVDQDEFDVADNDDFDLGGGDSDTA
jgi:hypothetical protein